MRCGVLLVMATAFLASVTAVTESKLTVAEQGKISTKRALRTTPNNEERAFSAGVSEGISNWFSRAVPTLLLTDDKLEHLAMHMVPADKVFKTLKLDEGLDGILRNPNLLAFDNYIVKTGVKNPELEFITPFIEKYGNEQLAKFLFDAKQNVKTKEIAARMQAAQFMKWFDEEKTTNDIYRLLDLRHLTHYEDKYQTIWSESVHAYIYLSNKLKKPIPFEM